MVNIFNNNYSSYGLLIVLGFIISLVYIFYKTKEDKKIREDCIYVYVISCIFGLIGSKILYIFTVVKSFIHDLQTYDIQLVLKAYLQGGLVFYGGLIVGYYAAYRFIKFYKADINKLASILIVSSLICFAFGRLGCFSVGCCHGIETTSNIFIIYKDSLYAPNNVKLVPIQLYEAIFDIILAIIIDRLSKKNYKAKVYITIHLLAYSIFRFICEFFRGDEIRGKIQFLSTSQFISILIILYVFIMLRRSNRSC